jgi:hypothetical protein
MQQFFYRFSIPSFFLFLFIVRLQSIASQDSATGEQLHSQQNVPAEVRHRQVFLAAASERCQYASCCCCQLGDAFPNIVALSRGHVGG